MYRSRCSNGIGRSGTLCASAITLQCLKAEKTVDIFQTIKKMRNQKPGMVETVVCIEVTYNVWLLVCIFIGPV